MTNVECKDSKVFSFFAFVGVIVSFAVSIMANLQNKKSTSILFLVAAFYCLSKISFRGKKSHLNNLECVKRGVPEVIMLLLFLIL